MQQVDIIIKNGMILTMDDKSSVYEHGFICIQGDTISHIGQVMKRNMRQKKSSMQEEG